MTDKTKEPRDIIFSIGDDPIPRDPETGELDIDSLSDEQKQRLIDEGREIFNMIAKTAPAFETLKQSMRRFSELIAAAIGTVNFSEWSEAAQHAIGRMKPAIDLLHELEDLKPYIEDELKKDEYGGVTFKEIIGDYTPADILDMLQDTDSLLYRLFEAARAAKDAALPVIALNKTDRLKTPVDRFNFLAFNDFKETGDQIAFNMMSDRDKRDPDRNRLNISMRYALNFGDEPGIKTTKELNHFDRRLQQAIDSLYVHGEQNIFLIGDISETMGGSRNPSESRRDKINSSLTKQGTARIFIDNTKEATEYDYPVIKYDGIILDFERIRVTYNGQEVTAIKVNNRPAMMEFADQRDQMSAVPIEVIQSGINQTDNRLRIEDYLLYRIIRQKNVISKLQEQQQKKYTQNRQKKIREAGNLVIMLETFHEHAGTAGKKKIVRDRAEAAAEKYLTHYAKTGYIAGYEIDAERIKIDLPIR